MVAKSSTRQDVNMLMIDDEDLESAGIPHEQKVIGEWRIAVAGTRRDRIVDLIRH